MRDPTQEYSEQTHVRHTFKQKVTRGDRVERIVNIGIESQNFGGSLPIDYEGKEMKISFDAHYVADMLRVLPPDATLNLELADPQTPALFKSGTDYSYVVMPLT